MLKSSKLLIEIRQYIEVCLDITWIIEQCYQKISNLLKTNISYYEKLCKNRFSAFNAEYFEIQWIQFH